MTDCPGDQPRPDPSVPTICAIIITYHPDLAVLRSLFGAIAPQIDQLVVVDNGSPTPMQQSLTEAIKLIDNDKSGPPTTLILNPVNAGIAAAQNQGLAIAGDRKVTHALLLDQDSLPAANMVARLAAAQQDHERPQQVAALGPVVVETKMDKPSYFVRLGALAYQRIAVSPEDPPMQADVLIASGCLIPMRAIEQIGLMDASLFIDRVDTEWCLRAAAAGLVCLGVPSAQLSHSIGPDSLKIALLGKEVSLHSPLRHYYAFRNSVLMMRRSYIPWRWRLNEGLLLAQMFAVYLSFAPRRRERLAKIVLGIWHGLRGRSGPFGK